MYQTVHERTVVFQGPPAERLCTALILLRYGPSLGFLFFYIYCCTAGHLRFHPDGWHHTWVNRRCLHQLQLQNLLHSPSSSTHQTHTTDTMSGAYYGYPPTQGYDPYYGGSSTKKEKKEKKDKKRGRSRSKSVTRKHSRSKSRHRSEKRKKTAPVGENLLVPDKDAYVRLLSEVRHWTDLKKRNLLMNTYATLSGEAQHIARDELQPKPPSHNKDPIHLPSSEKDKENNLLIYVNVSNYEQRVARVQEGSYILACRQEWGFFALYRKPTQANNSSSNILASFSKKNVLPTWEQLLEMTPVLVVLFLEVTKINDSSGEAVSKIHTLTAEKALKLQFAIKDSDHAKFVLSTGHKVCRQGQRVQGAKYPAVSEFYVDGEEFFPSLGDGILEAQSEIFMAAWWMSPYVFLKREKGVPFDQNFRLDNLLQRKALQGVKVYILLYQEIERATALTSLHTKNYLEALHPNIKVLRHRGPATTSLVFTHHQKFAVVDWRVLFIGGLDPCYGRWDTKEHPLFDVGDQPLFPGLDYRNPILLGDEANSQIKAPFLSALNKRTQHRLPWHDISVRLHGKIAFTAGLNFVQRWHHHCRKNGTEAVMLVPNVRVLYDKRSAEISANKTVDTILYRSMGEWSGNHTNERGIESAYLELIQKASDYIYIENQYFISSLYGSEVTNKIAAALVAKIIECFQDNTPFRCLLMIQPHGEGDAVGDQFIRSILYFQNQTLLKMQDALLQAMRKKEVVDRYLMVGYVQQYGFAPETNKPVFSPIYIHSKFIVSDDLRFIVGSANINDRSFVGDRDSELAVLISKPPDIKDGLPYSKQVRDLRLKLWNEHFGLPKEDLLDPASDVLWSKMRDIMTENAAIYEKVFPAVPTNRVTVLEDAQRQAAKAPNDEFASSLSKLRGHAVAYPKQWMSNAPPTLLSQAAGSNLLV